MKQSSITAISISLEVRSPLWFQHIYKTKYAPNGRKNIDQPDVNLNQELNLNSPPDCDFPSETPPHHLHTLSAKPKTMHFLLPLLALYTPLSLAAPIATSDESDLPAANLNDPGTLINLTYPDFEAVYGNSKGLTSTSPIGQGSAGKKGTNDVGHSGTSIGDSNGQGNRQGNSGVGNGQGNGVGNGEGHHGGSGGKKNADLKGAIGNLADKVSKGGAGGSV